METFSKSDYEIIEKAKQELDREHEEALDKFNMGKGLPMDERMRAYANIH